MQARQHEKPRAWSELPAGEMFPQVEIEEPFLENNEHLIAGLMATLAGVAGSNRSLKDREVLAALGLAIRYYQTLASSGLIYEEAITDLGQRALVNALHQAVQEFRELEQRHRGHTTLRDGDVLKALVFVLRLGHTYSSGRPLARGFVDFLHLRFPAQQSAIAGAGETTGQIILP